MRVAPCPTASIRLCASCGRNPDNQSSHLRAAQIPAINPNTRGERCADWLAAPSKPTPARTAD